MLCRPVQTAGHLVTAINLCPFMRRFLVGMEELLCHVRIAEEGIPRTPPRHFTHPPMFTPPPTHVCEAYLTLTAHHLLSHHHVTPQHMNARFWLPFLSKYTFLTALPPGSTMMQLLQAAPRCLIVFRLLCPFSCLCPA